MRLVLLKEIPDDDGLRHQWNGLVERSEQPQIFYTYEWARAVYCAYQATLRPLLFLAYNEQEELCGVAALATDPAGKRLSFLCASTGDYCDFISAPASCARFVGEIFSNLQTLGIREIALANLPSESATVPALQQAAKQNGYFLFARTGYVCAQASLKALRPKAGVRPPLPRKRMVQRFMNAMEREAPVRLDHARSWDAVGPILPDFIQAHVARFLSMGRISNMARAERRVFLAELAKLLSASGWLAFTRLMVGEKTAAWHYGFQFHGTWSWYQLTFDTGRARHSPGFCLLSKMIEEAVEDPAMDAVDLGLGSAEYKDGFASETRETLYVTLNASALQHGREAVRYRAASIVKTSGKVETYVRAILARANRARKHFREQGMGWLTGRLWHLLWTRMEVWFYEWDGPTQHEAAASKLMPIDLNQLADAAMEYVDEEETLAYLLRCAQRLRTAGAKGFALVDASGKVLHLAWLADFDGFFLSELKAKVCAVSPNDIMLFDCWTPVSLRGRGHYGQAIELIARQLQIDGKRPWIFSAASNTSSVRGLAKTGFRRRYSLYRKKFLWRETITGQQPVPPAVRPAEVSARV